jgi:hypothetical protein
MDDTENGGVVSSPRSEIAWGGCALFTWGGILIALALLATTAALVAAPTWRAWQRESIQQSQEYSETKQRLVLQLIDTHAQLGAEIAALDPETDAALIGAKQAQQRTLVMRLRTEVQTLSSSEVPPAVTTFLAQHGGR